MKKLISVFTALATIVWLVGPFMVFSANAVTIVEGDVVRETDEFDVYIIKLVGAEKFKRLILNPDVFNMYGHLKWENVKVAADGDLAAYTTSELVRAQGDEKVYKLYPDGDTGTKKWVESLDCFTSKGYNWNSVYVINSFDRDSYTTSADNLCGAVVTPTGEITLSLASDTPVATVIPLNGYGVTFMKINVAGSGTISQLTLKRTGAGSVDDFDNIYIYQGDVRLTAGRTLSSSTSKVTFIGLKIAAPTTLSIVADLSATAGNQDYFTIESSSDVTANATIGGTFPITGSPLSMSGSSAGTLTVERSGPTSRSVYIGETQIEVSRFKVTSNTEGTNIKRIQLFNSGDVTNSAVVNLNLKTTAGVTVATASKIGDDGYVTFSFTTSYYIKKGGNEIFYVYADTTGAAKPAKTIKLYLELATDILGVGTTFGYGMQATITNFDSDTYITTTLTGGAITLSKKGPNAANIGTDTDDSVMLEFTLAAAADITIKRTRLFVCIDAGGDGTWDSTSASADYEDLKIKDKNTGTVLIGPKDGSAVNDATHETACAATVGAYYEDFTDTMDLAAGETKTLQLSMDIKVANTNSGTVIAANAKVKAGIYSYATLVGTSGNVNYIKYAGTTDAVDDSAIVPSGDLAGETMTVQSSALTISLAATPAGSSAGSNAHTYIKGQSGVDAVGLILTAGAASDIQISAVTLTAYMSGVAAAANTYATAAKWLSGQDGTYVKDHIAKVYLYDTTTGALVPGSTGKGFSGDTFELVEFTGINWTIPAGKDRTMLVKVDGSSASTASGSYADLFFAFDVEAAANITATDKDGNSVTPTGHTANGGSATDASVAPNTDFGIAQRGSLAIAVASDTPDRKVLVMGTADNEVSKFKLTGTNEGWYLDKFSVVLYDGAAESLDDLDNFTALKLKYQTESQWGTSDWTISPAQTFAATASKAFSFSGSERPYVPKDDNSYMTALVSIAAYSGGNGAKSKVPVRIGYTDASENSFKAYGAQSGYYLNDITAITATDYKLHYIARSKPVFAKKAWGGGETELARFTITAEGYDIIFKNTDWAEGTGVAADTTDDAYFSGINAPASAYLEFEVVASATDVTVGATSSTTFNLYDWNESVVASVPYAYVGGPSAECGDSNDLFGCVATIGFHFEESTSGVTIPSGTTKEFHVDIDGGDLTDFNNTDEYVYLKLANDVGDDLATESTGYWGSQIIYHDSTIEEGISGQGDPENRYLMPQDVTNIGTLPVIFRTLRGNVTPS